MIASQQFLGVRRLGIRSLNESSSLIGLTFGDS